MRNRLVLAVVGVLITLVASACATKKYARNRINERVTPVEHRTGELEETSRRNTGDIARLGEGISEVRGRVDRTASQAESALGRAGEADQRAQSIDRSVTELRSNVDRYAVEHTATVNFKFDSHELTPEGQQSLDGLAAQIKDRLNFLLEIEGFADWTGAESYNDQLTQKRANAVRRYLAEQHSIPLFRMYILGFGENRPVADNRTRDGRAQNRRVEIRLLKRNLGAGPTAHTRT